MIFYYLDVVMPTHVHLLLTPADAHLVAIKQRFKRFTGEQIAKVRGQEGGVWQARYFDFILRRVQDFWEKLEYIHNNPVAAGLVGRPEDWSWSSAAHYARLSKSSMVDAVDFPADRDALLWPAPWR
jgi:putative transposase